MPLYNIADLGNQAQAFWDVTQCRLVNNYWSGNQQVPVGQLTVTGRATNRYRSDNYELPVGKLSLSGRATNNYRSDN